MLKGVQYGGPVAVGKVEFTGGAGGDVVGDDPSDFGAEGLAGDCWTY